MIIKRLPLLIAGGIGYVLGTKAGRERYEQIMRTANKVKNDPRVQEKAQHATDLAREKAPHIKDKVSDVAGSAASKMPGTGGGSHVSDTSDLNPDRLKAGQNTGPQGDLP
jgi:hypothetical protein